MDHSSSVAVAKSTDPGERTRADTTDTALPKLPDEVLLMIMAVSSPATIAALMRTCRTLYDSSLGPRILLRDGASLSTDEQLISFSKFMTASPTVRFRYLRSLTLSRGGFSLEALTAFDQVIVHPLLKIESLVLHDAESILTSGSQGEWAEMDAGLLLLNALQNVSTLKHLSIDDVDERALALLRKQSSALVSASLMLNAPGSQWHNLGHYDADNLNPIVLLANSADSLEVLDGSGFDLNPENVMYDVVYPRVRRICASYWSDSMPGTAPYVHSYPNLEHLALMRSPPPASGHSMHAANAAANAGVVPANHILQTRYTNRQDQINFGSWQRLCIVEGTVQDVYVLGLVCHVPHLRLFGGFTEEELADVLQDVKPGTLALTVAGGQWFEEDGAASLVLARPEAQCLHSLELEICIVPQERPEDLQQLLAHLNRVLAHMPSLRAFSLTLNHALITHPGQWQRKRDSPGPGPSDEYRCPMMDNLRVFDAEMHASLFKAHVPTLEDVTVKVSAEGTWADNLMPSQFQLSMRGSSLEQGDSDGEGSATEEEEIVTELAELGFGTLVDDEDGW